MRAGSGRWPGCRDRGGRVGRASCSRSYTLVSKLGQVRSLYLAPVCRNENLAVCYEECLRINSLCPLIASHCVVVVID